MSGGSYFKESPDAEPKLVERTGERTECLQDQGAKYRGIEDVIDAVDDAENVEGGE